MFIHYYRYKTKYSAKNISADERLEIVYPTDEHSMITVGHDFYVIGAFHGIEVRENALLKVELNQLETGEIVRTVCADKKDNREGMYVEFEGIDTADDRETVRSCGMPDLVYDPAQPESFWYTWNKAYYTNQVFSALIYGGTCRMDGISPFDQFGKELKSLTEGYYELKVTLINGEEQISSSKTLWFTQGQKEMILSRFSPEVHLERLEHFAEEEGFEPYTDPYAGIWDTQYFSFEWPVKAWVEIPARWHFGDAQEYESGTVHFFNYNISEACVSWKTEIGNMLAKERVCVDNPNRLRTYYYKNGHPETETQEVPAGTLAVMDTGQYFCITKADWKEQDRYLLEVCAICKPLPAETEPISGCAYAIKNRLAYFDYYFYFGEARDPFFVSERHKTGVIGLKENASDEFLILHVQHEIAVGGYRLSGKENRMDSGKNQTVRMEIAARDLNGFVWERKVLYIR